MIIPEGRRLAVYAHTSEAMSEVDSGSIPLVIAGPLYFPMCLAGTLAGRGKAASGASETRRMITGYALGLSPVFREISRVLIPGGHLVLQTRDVRVGTVLTGVEGLHRGLCEAAGLALTARHFWLSTFERQARKNLSAALAKESGPAPMDPEVFLVFQKEGEPHLGEGRQEDQALLRSGFMRTATGKMKARHPFQAPLPVLEAFVRTYSRAGETVLDPFAGCGSSAFAALRNGRDAVLYETDPAALCMIAENFKEA